MKKDVAFVTSQVNRRDGAAYIGAVLHQQCLSESQQATLAERIAAKIGHLIDYIKFEFINGNSVILVVTLIKNGHSKLRRKARQFAQLLREVGVVKEAINCSPLPAVG